MNDMFDLYLIPKLKSPVFYQNILIIMVQDLKN